ncbi:hypothetical protein GPECTOR_105g94 [Gonium pectorale]|uniref:DNA mismatch repair proteins mutS family domain-containing protein n=1 Tax=Gonium pectorale TaxID=33097 RepID=A0A150FZP0_GONPE|nr:hypothetical protein GPECTOR_105g94 [Gonium pectorale]|eukprot:KXZ43062.1 hypothetical protein GPECTOR_105g94 [Gonium pectorale]
MARNSAPGTLSALHALFNREQEDVDFDEEPLPSALQPRRGRAGQATGRQAAAANPSLSAQQQQPLASGGRESGRPAVGALGAGAGAAAAGSSHRLAPTGHAAAAGGGGAGGSGAGGSSANFATAAGAGAGAGRVPPLVPPFAARVVASVIENRAREVGLAVLDPATLTLQLSQYIEPGRSYAMTRLLLRMVAASEVVAVAPSERLQAAQRGFHEAGLNRALAAQQQQSEAAVAAAAPPAPAAAAGRRRAAAGDDVSVGGDLGDEDGEDEEGFRADGAGGGFVLVPMPRSCFDDTQGAQLLAAYATPDSRAVVAAASGRDAQYLALGAAGALLQHLLGPSAVAAALGTAAPRGGGGLGPSAGPQLPGGGPLRAACLRVQTLDAGLHCRLEPGLADALEIVSPAGVFGRSSSSSSSSPSLFRVLGRPLRTRAGVRLLRSSLLQPLADEATLNMRYDTIEELLAEETMAFDLGQVLALLPRDLDKMCYSIASAGAAAARAGSAADPGRGIGPLVQSLLLLRDTLALLPPLAEVLQTARSPLLMAVRSTCCDEGLAALRTRIDEVLDEEASCSSLARGGAFVSRVQQCFAVRPSASPDGLLELARSSLCRLTEAVHELGDRYAEQWELPGLKVSYNSRKGFYLTLLASAAAKAQPGGGGGSAPHHLDPSAAADAAANAGGCSRLPPGASQLMPPAGQGGWRQGGGRQQPVAAQAAAAARLPPQLLVLERRGRGSLLLTSHELNALNCRLHDATNDCLLLTRQLLEGVVCDAACQLPSLQRLVDGAALIDLMAGFAEVAAGGVMGPCVRPQLRTGGPLAIVQANDTFLSPAAPLHVVTGPNMSGKSTYLQQVGLLVVMAQAGCWVPAEFASLSPFGAVLGRLNSGGGGVGGGGGWGPEDDLEAGSSSFLTEMQDAASVLACAGPRSLVLLDELGRATSTADGVGLAWAVCEELLAAGCPTLLATHFQQLGELAVLYPQARLWRLLVDTRGGGGLDFRWLLEPAAALDYLHYGLLLAAAAGLPREVVDEARRVAEMLEETDRRRLEVSAADSGLWAQAASVCGRLTVLAQQWRDQQASAEATAQALALLHSLMEELEALPLTQLSRELSDQD